MEFSSRMSSFSRRCRFCKTSVALGGSRTLLGLCIQGQILEAAL